MKSQETRQKDMLVRVQQFGRAHRDLFPDGSSGGETFAALDAVVAALNEHGDTERKTAEEGRRKKAAARQALRDRLKAISWTARTIAEEEPGFADRFKLANPSRQSDDEVLSAGRVFAEEAEASRGLFLTHGMRDTFVADLNGLVQAFSQAIENTQAERAGQTAAHAGITSALTQALALVRKLDVIVHNQLTGNDVVLAVWGQARKVEHARRGRRAADASPAAGTEPAAPLPLPQPAAATTAVAAPAPATAGPEASVTSELTRRIAS